MKNKDLLIKIILLIIFIIGCYIECNISKPGSVSNGIIDSAKINQKQIL